MIMGEQQTPQDDSRFIFHFALIFREKMLRRGKLWLASSLVTVWCKQAKIPPNILFPSVLPSLMSSCPGDLPSVCFALSQSSLLDSSTCLSALCFPHHWDVPNKQEQGDSTCMWCGRLSTQSIWFNNDESKQGGKSLFFCQIQLCWWGFVAIFWPFE